MNVTYRDTVTDETVIHSAPVLGLERSKRWQRVEAPSYFTLNKPALVELCEAREIDAVGTVPELRERLQAYDVEHAQD